MEEMVLPMAVVRTKTQSSLRMVDMDMASLEHKHLALDDGHTSKALVADYIGGKCVVEDA